MQQRFKSERHNVFTEEINKIALSSNDDKRTQSINSVEINAYGTRKYLKYKRNKTKRKNKTMQKMINFDDVMKENI